MSNLRGYIQDYESGAFPWPGSLDKLEQYVRDIRGNVVSDIVYWTEEVEQNGQSIKLVIWKVE